jgi:hypothetical protein
VALEKKLVIVKYVKLGMMLTVVVLCTLMISTIDLSQSLVFAQNTTSITPAPELAGSSDDDSTSNDNDNNESNGSSDDNGNDNDSSSEYSNNDNDGNDVDSDSQQDTLSSEEDETEDEFEQTNPLLEQIRNSVKGALSGTGMAIP